MKKILLPLILLTLVACGKKHKHEWVYHYDDNDGGDVIINNNNNNNNNNNGSTNNQGGLSNYNGHYSPCTVNLYNQNFLVNCNSDDLQRVAACTGLCSTVDSFVRVYATKASMQVETMVNASQSSPQNYGAIFQGSNTYDLNDCLLNQNYTDNQNVNEFVTISCDSME